MSQSEKQDAGSEKKKEKKSFLVGFGFDHDNEKRITEGENFILAGGSDKTHSRMLERVFEFNRILKNQYGKKLEDLSREEYYQIVRDIGDEEIQWKYWNELYNYHLKSQKKKRF